MKQSTCFAWRCIYAQCGWNVNPRVTQWGTKVNLRVTARACSRASSASTRRRSARGLSSGAATRTVILRIALRIRFIKKSVWLWSRCMYWAAASACSLISWKYTAPLICIHSSIHSSCSHLMILASYINHSFRPGIWLMNSIGLFGMQHFHFQWCPCMLWCSTGIRSQYTEQTSWLFTTASMFQGYRCGSNACKASGQCHTSLSNMCFNSSAICLDSSISAIWA